MTEGGRPARQIDCVARDPTHRLGGIVDRQKADAHPVLRCSYDRVARECVGIAWSQTTSGPRGRRALHEAGFEALFHAFDEMFLLRGGESAPALQGRGMITQQIEVISQASDRLLRLSYAGSCPEGEIRPVLDGGERIRDLALT